MFIKTGIQLSLVCIALLISSCDVFKNDSLNNICQEHPELCDDLYIIADCRFKRTTVIRARYYDKIEANEVNKQKLLTELDEYQSCLELTLFLQFTRNKQRKEYRLSNYLTAQTLMQTHIEESRGTQDPILAYYLWTHHQDLQARQVFLAAATEKTVSDPRLLFKLARVNSTGTPQDALNLFYKALALSRSTEEIPNSTFLLIMTIFYQHKKFEEAYIWALISLKGDQQNASPINLDLILKRGVVGGERVILNDRNLALIAEQYYQQLKVGKFNEQAPLLQTPSITKTLIN